MLRGAHRCEILNFIAILLDFSIPTFKMPLFSNQCHNFHIKNFVKTVNSTAVVIQPLVQLNFVLNGQKY